MAFCCQGTNFLRHTRVVVQGLSEVIIKLRYTGSSFGHLHGCDTYYNESVMSEGAKVKNMINNLSTLPVSTIEFYLTLEAEILCPASIRIIFLSWSSFSSFKILLTLVNSSTLKYKMTLMLLSVE